MDTIFILILIFVLFFYLIKRGIENEKLRQERKQLHWKKVRYIQSLAASTKENIYERNNGRCQKCGSRKKICFYITTDDITELDSWSVKLICSECKGFSIGYPFTRMIPDGTREVVWQRDRGKCKKCGSNYNICYDHIIPFSYGGASADADNIQLLCSSCNLSKHASFRF